LNERGVAQKGLIRAKSSFPVKTRLLYLNSARVAYRPQVQKKSPRRFFFKVHFVSLAKVNFKPPMNKLPFRTANVQGQSRQPNFRNLPIQILTDWRTLDKINQTLLHTF